MNSHYGLAIHRREVGGGARRLPTTHAHTKRSVTSTHDRPIKNIPGRSPLKASVNRRLRRRP